MVAIIRLYKADRTGIPGEKLKFVVGQKDSKFSAQIVRARIYWTQNLNAQIFGNYSTMVIWSS